MFRIANERMEEWSERHEGEGPELYFCECADRECQVKVRLDKPEYESIRANSRRFLVAAGHEIPDIETVLESHGEWLVIEKDPEVTETVEALDPRRAPG